MIKALKIVVFFSFILTPSLIYADQLTLTTYYPSPYGSYSQMRLVPQADLADSVCANGGTPLTGALYMNNTEDVKICKAAGTWNLFNLWTQTGNNISLKSSELVANAGWKVGIGIIPTANSMKLHLAQDGGILAEGAYGSGAAVGNPGGGVRFLWYPAKAAIRAGWATGAQFNDANIGDFSVAFGQDNIASMDRTVAFGRSNTNNQSYGSILGGFSNTIQNNGTASVIAGGDTNLSTDYDNFIGGGYNNTASARNAIVVGGYQNTASGTYSFVGGGGGNTIGNTAGGSLSAIVGGSLNVSNGGGSFIGSGSRNAASGSYSVVGGGGGPNAGDGNVASGTNATIGGGLSNTAANVLVPTIGGGGSNTAGGDFTTVGGGQGNNAKTRYSTIGGGSGNSAGTVAGSKEGATVGGGVNNNASGAYSTIPGGIGNIASGANSIAIGSAQTASGDWSLAMGGQANTVSGTSSFALGQGNSVTGSNDYNFGVLNTMQGSNSVAFGNHAGVMGAGTNFDFVFAPSGPCNVSVSSVAVFYPCNDGSMIIGTTANAAAASNGPYTLYVNGSIGGRLDGANEGKLFVQFVNTGVQATTGYYAVYAP